MTVTRISFSRHCEQWNLFLFFISSSSSISISWYLHFPFILLSCSPFHLLWTGSAHLTSWRQKPHIYGPGTGQSCWIPPSSDKGPQEMEGNSHLPSYREWPLALGAETLCSLQSAQGSRQQRALDLPQQTELVQQKLGGDRGTEGK